MSRESFDVPVEPAVIQFVEAEFNHGFGSDYLEKRGFEWFRLKFQ